MVRTLLILFVAVMAGCLAVPGDPNDLTAVPPVAPGNPGTPPPVGPGKFHPDGWRDPAQHGPAAKLKELDCLSCHGNDLTGGAALSCDTCHQTGWRTNCTFCHGGTAERSGAPPRDIRGVTDPLLNSFRAHTSHVSEGIHAAYDCSQCHKKPIDVTTPGHLFDDTPGKAEVDFSGGLSAQGQYLGEGRCSNLYCHGDGRGNTGSYEHTRPRPACTTCHNVEYTGAHYEHLKNELLCSDCHGDTVRGQNEIINPSLHVNGTLDLALPAQISRSSGLCTGSCHGEPHQSREWRDGDD